MAYERHPTDRNRGSRREVGNVESGGQADDGAFQLLDPRVGLLVFFREMFFRVDLEVADHVRKPEVVPRAARMQIVVGSRRLYSRDRSSSNNRRCRAAGRIRGRRIRQRSVPAAVTATWRPVETLGLHSRHV